MLSMKNYVQFVYTHTSKIK